MSDLFGFFEDDKEERNMREEAVDDKKLLLRQEELDIDKDRFETGEVILSKEIVEETKEVDVPVLHEEVVIERRAINHEMSDSPIGEEETIHIPVSEERVEVGKHTVITGEVSAYKREVEETQHVEENLRREEARVNTTGDPVIVNDEEFSR
ncbi:YsnF/AvaK domain-containing protein [Bacillus salipaludis]|uniref:YsnF/AvaK domain-containing protein n=1 Tax=Bacillus salipaludis TaxID=2547811 RepID=UPI002E1B3D10|nr:YsnF/AvaK domain-containing protein [Bacillus salipaludis]